MEYLLAAVQRRRGGCSWNNGCCWRCARCDRAGGAGRGRAVLEHAGLTLVSRRANASRAGDRRLLFHGLSARPTRAASTGPRKLAAQIVEESPQGDGFTLVLMAAPPRVVVGTPAFEAAPIREEIDNLELPTPAPICRPRSPPCRAWSSGAGRESPRLAQHRQGLLPHRPAAGHLGAGLERGGQGRVPPAEPGAGRSGRAGRDRPGPAAPRTWPSPTFARSSRWPWWATAVHFEADG